MLNETCLLVALNISLPPQSKTSKEASADVEHRYKTARKQGKVTKQLFSAKDIRPLTQAMTAARTAFNDASLPYDSSYRIIPTKNYFEFFEKIAQYSDRFDAEKHKFLRKYNEILQNAANDLGELFDYGDYPSVDALSNRIGLSVESSVIPAATAFDDLAGLTPEAVEKLKDEAIKGQQKKIEDALHDLFRRLFVSLQKASSKLSDEEGVFRDTLIGNIYAALEAIENLNLTGNEDLTSLANEVRNVLEGVTPDQLRKDKELREETVEETRQLLDKMNNFF